MIDQNLSNDTSDPPPDYGLQRRAVVRQMLWPLLITYAFLPITFLLPTVDSTREPYFDLTSGFSTAVYWISESCSKFGAPIIVVLMLLLLVSREGISGTRRAREVVLVLLAIAVFGGGGSYLNENTLKVYLKVPRPNIVFLSGAEGGGALGMSPDQFYETGDKIARQAPLREVLTAGSSPIELAPAIREHWIEVTGYSFPSGHSMAAMFLATLFLGLGISYVSPPRKWLFYLMLPWALAVCYSRPILRVHTPTDITVGGLQGIIVGFVALLAVRKALELWGNRAPESEPSR